MDRYRELEDEVNGSTGADLAFDLRLSAARYPLGVEAVRGFSTRYAAIKEFQEITRDLFNASLRGDADPEIARLVLNELPEDQGWAYHEGLALHDTPVFFRTDEAEPGAITEIQSPGSVWGTCDLLYRYCDAHRDEYGESALPGTNVAAGFARDLRAFMGGEPLVHHLADNSSMPGDTRYFIQRTRREGIRYFGWDRGVTPYGANFVRAHAFAGLVSDNFRAERLAKYREGAIRYDLPPSILFDEKMIYILPFWERTRACYPDRVRALFPHTALVTPDGFELPGGRRIGLGEFSGLPKGRRGWYVKYAGCDLSINWGAKGVHLASAFSGAALEKFMGRITADWSRKRYWIIQEARRVEGDCDWFRSDGGTAHSRAHAKFSGFYGPAGLLGILVMQRPFFKVHGAGDTIVGVV